MTSIRGSAWLIVLAAILPLVLFAVFQIGFSAQEQRRSVEEKALAQSEAIILAADARVERLTAGADALATSQAVKAVDEAGFSARAAELAGIFRDWRGAQLIDPRTGATVSSYGSATNSLVRSGQPGKQHARFVGYTTGSGCQCLVFEREAPSKRGDKLILRLLISSAPFEQLLPATTSEYPVSAFAGTDGRFVARSVSHASRFGQLGSDYLRAVTFSGKSHGLYRGFTLEGFENYTAYTRSNLTGWSAHIALGSRLIDDPARKFLVSIGFAALVSLLLAGLLIAFALRQMNQAKRLAERMQQAQKLEALGQLTGGIAHDFNNLLTPVIGALDVIRKRDSLDARSRRLATGALASAERAGALTSQLLTFSRRQKLRVEPVDLSATFTNLRGFLEQSVATTHVLSFDLPEGVRCVESDANQLEVALLNLALNARDASEPGSEIAIRARMSEDRDRVFIEVEDHGVGMTPELKARAMEPFFTTKEVGRGTGLGLAQVFGVVSQSGGNVQILGEPGKGTTIRIELVACDAPLLELVDVSRSLGAAGGEPSLRLLVVDDDAAVRAAIVGPLEEAGHIVDSMASPAAALAAIDAEPFDLIITDYAMPHMTGAELIQQARERRPDAKFLIVTGYSDSDAVASASPTTPILAKPFTPDELLRAVEQAAFQGAEAA